MELTLAFTMDGPSDAPPLLLLHGFSGSARSWDALVPPLAAAAWVIRPDLPGHGATEANTPADASFPTALQALAALLDSLGVRSTALLGYSMGGRLALAFALAYPDRVSRLILESATPGIEDEAERAARRASDEQLADNIEQRGIGWFAEAWASLPLFASHRRLPADIQTALHRRRLNNNPRGLANSLRGMGTGVMPPMWDDLARLEMPVLLITGSDDIKFTAIAQRMVPKLSQGQHVVVDGSGHTPHLEMPGVFLRLVSQFIQH